MTQQDYNGWTGNGDRDSAWATWNVALWLDNDYGTYQERLRVGRRQPCGEWTARSAEDFCSDMFPEGKTPDGAPLSDVNYSEIAENWNEE